MSKSKLSLTTISLALMAPLVAQAACQANISSVPDPIVEPPIDWSNQGGASDIVHQTQTQARTTAQSASTAYGYSEGSPETPAIPLSVTPGADPGCMSDTFGAHLAAQGLRQTRQHLARAQQRMAQLRALRAPEASAQGLQVYAMGGDQSRREGGDASQNTQALRVGRTDVNVGADYRINDQWAAGAAIGLGNTRMRWDGSTSRIDSQSGNLTAYVNWSPTAAGYVALAISVENAHDDLHADDGYEYPTTSVHSGLSLSAGYDVPMGTWTLSPYARVDEVASRVGSFGGPATRTKGSSGSVSAGTQVQTTIPTSWGLIAPHARIEFTQITGWHIQGNSAATYVSGQGLLPAPSPLAIDRQFGQIGAGTSLILQRGLTVFADYDTGFAQRDVSTWRMTLGVRYEL